MNSLLLRTLAVPRPPSLQTFSEYKEAEANNANGKQSSVSTDGALLEYETLELRVHPPNVEVDNETYDDRTIITVDSANRPGTLVEVVQCLTELGLNVKKARISSDGGWFVDEFHVTENNSRKVLSDRKLLAIKKVLSIDYEPEGDSDTTDQFDEAKQCSTVFELSGQDKAGLLADVIFLLTQNGCDVRSAAVWTYNRRVAFVVSVLEKSQPIKDGVKLQRLKDILYNMMDARGNGIVSAQTVKGLIHYERRLHQLMLQEEEKDWQRSRQLSTVKSSSFALASSTVQEGSSTTVDAHHDSQLYISPKHSRPEVTVSHFNHLHYWLVTIKCKDRNKLFFDTVCTLADLKYDVYHGAIDSEGEMATQVYYIRPRFGDFYWEEQKAAKLKYLLEAAIQRRFPKGLKVHVQSVDHHCLSSLTTAWKEAGLWITRAKVRAYCENGHTFYVMDASGAPPDMRKVQMACQRSGGKLQGVQEQQFFPTTNGKVDHKFLFAFLQRTWDGSPSSLGSL